MQRWGLVQDGPWTSGLTEGQNWTGQDILLGLPVETLSNSETQKDLVARRPEKTHKDLRPLSVLYPDFLESHLF